MQYANILKYYKECFSLIDTFHFNSKVTESVYKQHLDQVSGNIIPITHNDINDNRKKKEFDNKILEIGFIGHETEYKGLPMLINILSQLNRSDWKLSVWGGRKARHKTLPIEYKGTFDKNMLDRIYNEMDLLIVPSIWKETFSFVALEAISFGVPVIVSKNVGAQDIIAKYNPEFIFNSPNELKILINKILDKRNYLSDFNKNILDREWPYNMKNHAQQIIEKIYK